MDQAHIVDEYIEIDQLHKAVDLYSAVIRQAQKDLVYEKVSFGMFCMRQTL